MAYTPYQFRAALEYANTNGIQPGAMYSSFIDTHMVSQVEALHTDALLTRKSWAWAYPTAAPTLHADDTSQHNFQMPPTDTSQSGVDFQPPWCSQNGVISIAADVWVAVYSKYVNLKVALHAYSFATYSITTTNGVQVPISLGRTPTGEWAKRSKYGQVSVGYARINVTPTDWASGRRLCLRVSGQWDPVSADGAPSGQERIARIVAMRAFDISPLDS